MKNKSLLFLFSLVLIFFACSNDECYRKYFPNKFWAYGDSLEPKFNVPNTEQAYSIKLKLDITEDYQYQNIYLLFRVIQPDGKVQSSLTNFVLLDNISGKWFGSKKWFSKEYHYEKTLSKGIKFPAEGEYKIRVIQYMRDDSLRGISGVGVCVVRE